MASRQDVPGVSEFLTAYADGVRGSRGYRYSTRRGGRFDAFGGASAILFSRQAARLKAEFAQNYTGTATGSALSRQLQARYGVTPTLADFGYGSLVLTRPAGTGAGTIYAGTRVLVRRANMTVEYRVQTDTDVTAAATEVLAPIRTMQMGASPPMVATTNELVLDDAVFDATFVPTLLTCASGVDAEAPASALLRGRTALAERAVGIPDAIVRGCKAAGADTVVLVPGHTFGDALDPKVSFVYVGDSNFTTPDGLVESCYVMLENYRTVGHDLQVLPMAPQTVVAQVDVYVSALVPDLTQIALRAEVVTAMVDVFDRRAQFWLFDTQTLAGAASSVVQAIARKVIVTTTPSPPAAGFPAVLPWYTLRSGDVTVAFIKG